MAQVTLRSKAAFQISKGLVNTCSCRKLPVAELGHPSTGLLLYQLNSYIPVLKKSMDEYSDSDP